MKLKSRKVLVIDKRPNIAGNVFAEEIEEINVHKYGAHIFHINNKRVWEYVNQFADFNLFTNLPVANYNYSGALRTVIFSQLSRGTVSHPFNIMWNVVTPREAAKIEEQKKQAGIAEPKNPEEQAYQPGGNGYPNKKLVKGYTEKQWGAHAISFLHYKAVSSTFNL